MLVNCNIPDRHDSNTIKAKAKRKAVQKVVCVIERLRPVADAVKRGGLTFDQYCICRYFMSPGGRSVSLVTSEMNMQSPSTFHEIFRAVDMHHGVAGPIAHFALGLGKGLAGRGVPSFFLYLHFIPKLTKRESGC